MEIDVVIINHISSLIFLAASPYRVLFHSHEELDFKISDHQSTLTTFNNINSELQTFHFKKTDWNRF
ncbi:hypothetical protein BpHYR1_004864, partial [Brachionus plicatilis]